MNNEQIEYTKTWWHSCINDHAKMGAWLQKLQRTELGGYTDHIEFMDRNIVGAREKLILTNIAHDELKHSSFLIEVLIARNLEVKPEGPNSTYWDSILSHVNSVRQCCAANYYGEALASERFEIIRSIKETPWDVKAFIDFALPDEIFHRETLQRLAGEEALTKFKAYHDDGLRNLQK